MLIQTTANRQVVMMASEEAQSRSVRNGMTLAEARALCPALEHAPYEPEKDLRALQALARWLMRFTPVVACSTGASPVPSGCGMGASPMHHAILLDLTGCQRLFGSLANLLEQVTEALHAMNLHAATAIAPTIGAAWALAFAAKHSGQIITQQHLLNALAPLPPIALRIDEPTAESLHHLGIQTIAQLTQLPRQTLPSRFGSNLLLRLDQATGQIPEPLTPLDHQPPIQAHMDFDSVIDSPETIWLVFKELLSQIITDLARRGCGARKLQLHFHRPCSPPLSKTILLSRPSRDPANLFNLLRCAQEGLENSIPNPDSHIPPGFTAIHLFVPLFERIADEQIPLLDHEQHTAHLELDHLIERLTLRLGEQHIAQARLAESYLPERAYTLTPHFTPHSSLRTQHSGLSTQDLALRPLHLLPSPLEIAVMVCPSHDRDGKPISFRHQNQLHRVIHAIGPERIAGQWWEGHNKTRDYFTIEDESARRHWIFRVMETGKWYWQGNFE